jgi:hypothetical protein
VILNFASLVFVDHIDLAGTLRRHEGLYDRGTPRILPIRYPRKGTQLEDEDFVSGPRDGAVAKWVELKNFLGRLKREAEKVAGPIDLGHVWLEMLDPGATLPWTTESGAYIERHTRVHLALRTNPAATMVSGSEAFSPAPGWVTAVNVRVPCTAVNMGQHPRVHLVLDWRRKELNNEKS